MQSLTVSGVVFRTAAAWSSVSVAAIAQASASSGLRTPLAPVLATWV